MSAPAEPGDAFNALVAVAEAAFAAGDYAAASRALAAAMHLAREAGDRARLAEASQLARDQRARLAEIAPPPQLADRTRGPASGPRLYQALETTMAYLQVLGAREAAAEREGHRRRAPSGMGLAAVSTAVVLAGSAAAGGVSRRLLTAAVLLLLGAGLMYLAWLVRRRGR